MKYRIFKTESEVELAILALARGYSGRYLAQRCGMSRSMVYYRLKQSGIKLWDVRNGVAPLSRSVEQAMEDIVRDYVSKKILPKFQ